MSGRHPVTVGDRGAADLRIAACSRSDVFSLSVNPHRCQTRRDRYREPVGRLAGACGPGDVDRAVRLRGSTAAGGLPTGAAAGNGKRR